MKLHQIIAPLAIGGLSAILLAYEPSDKANQPNQVYFRYYDVDGCGKYELRQLISKKPNGETRIVDTFWLGLDKSVTKEQAYALRGINVPIEFRRLE